MQMKTIWSQFWACSDARREGSSVGRSWSRVALEAKVPNALAPRTTRMTQRRDHALAQETRERGKHLMRQGSLETLRHHTQEAQHIVRRVRVHHRRHEDTFAYAPLRDPDGLFVVEEHLARSAPRKTHESVRRVTLERPVMNRDDTVEDVGQHVGPPLSDHS